MKKRGFPVRGGIDGIAPCCFVPVTARATQAKVGERGFSAFSKRDDVVDFKGDAHGAFLTAAISALAVGGRHYGFAELRWNARAHTFVPALF